MSSPIRQSEIEAYIDEALPQDDMARIEKALRENPSLAKQAAMVQSRRSAGVHSLAEIWRIGRLPSSHLILHHPLPLLPSIFFPASGSFPLSQLFTSGGQRI